MQMSGIEEIREALRSMKLRLARGEMDEGSYRRQREILLEDLSTEERTALGTTTPAPAGRADPRSGTPLPLGPSGTAGSGARTAIPPLADLTLEPGVELLGQWRITRELGRGGFGAVFEAEELHLGETQAVKVLDPAMVAREELLARFRREVQVMRRLVHPHIVRVYDYREDLDDHLALISMEYVPGGTVKDLMGLSRESGEPVPVVPALRILAQVLEALVEAHGQEVVHRDVTPGNILLAGASARELLEDPTRDPRAKLVDFGVAGLVERAELSHKSRVLGTAAYVAPEVLDPSAPVTPAADVYGLGAVVYELLTGTAPLGRFADPSEERSELGGEVDELLLGLLDPKPGRRPTAEQARSRSVVVIGAAEERERRRREEGARRTDDAEHRAEGGAAAAVSAEPASRTGNSVGETVGSNARAANAASAGEAGAALARETSGGPRVVLGLSGLAVAVAAVVLLALGVRTEEAAVPIGAVVDPLTELVWTEKDNGSSIDWDEAERYCEQLTLGGFSDWRMATIGELEGLYDEDENESDPCLQEICHPRLGIDLTGPWVWSSTRHPSSRRAFSIFMFGVGTRLGGFFADLKRDEYENTRVLCVRGPRPWYRWWPSSPDPSRARSEA